MREFEVRTPYLPDDPDRSHRSYFIEAERRTDVAAKLKREWPNWRRLGITINKPSPRADGRFDRRDLCRFRRYKRGES